MRNLFIAALFALATPVHAATLAFGEQGGVRVELTDEKCVVAFALAQVADAEKALNAKLDPRAARYIEAGKTSAGCWLMHPQAPAVVLLWEDNTSGIAPVVAFTPVK